MGVECSEEVDAVGATGAIPCYRVVRGLFVLACTNDKQEDISKKKVAGTTAAVVVVVKVQRLSLSGARLCHSPIRSLNSQTNTSRQPPILYILRSSLQVTTTSK